MSVEVSSHFDRFYLRNLIFGRPMLYLGPILNTVVVSCVVIEA
jgi:hypothetical protein